jgi:hypothetical protein
LNEPDGPLSPTAHTIAAPGLVAAAPTLSVLLALGLATTFHAVPGVHRYSPGDKTRLLQVKETHGSSSGSANRAADRPG